MKRLNSIYLLLAIFLGGMSCSDFLDNPPQGVLTPDTFYQNEKEATQGLMGAYFWLQGDDWWFQDPHRTYGDVCSDNSFVGYENDVPEYVLISEFRLNSLNGYLQYFWNFSYKAIFSANVVINRTETALIPEEANKKQIIAEAKVLRAFHYFNLIRSFGGVIIMDHETTGVELEEDLTRGRSTEAESWDFVAADLLSAIEDLPVRSQQAGDQGGRITKGTAQALLAKVYLYQEDWANALTMSENVINSNEYGLMSLIDLWDGNTPNSLESVFEIAVSNSTIATTGSGIPLWHGSRNNNNFSGAQESTYAYGWGYNTPSSHLDLAYTTSDGAEDPRRPFTIIRHNELIDLQGNPDPNGYPYNAFESSDTDFSNTSGRINRKAFYNPTLRLGEWRQDAFHYKIIRYADVLLMAAEAAYKTGNEGKALLYVNQVRQRAWNDPSRDIQGSGQALYDAIKLERRLELAMEGERFYDLKRWGDLEQALANFVDYNVNLNNDYDGIINSNGDRNYKGDLFNPLIHTVFPIPQRQIDLSNGAVEQNPGY